MTATPPSAGWPSETELNNAADPALPPLPHFQAAPAAPEAFPQNPGAAPPPPPGPNGWVAAPSPIHADYSAAPAQGEHAHSRALLGKIGYWVMVGSFALVTGGNLVRLGFHNQAVDAGSHPAMPSWLIILGLAFTVIFWLGMLVATALGVAGLIRRERPVWWSIVSVCSLLIGLIVGPLIAAVTLLTAGL